MPTFMQLWECMHSHNEHTETGAVRAIRTGLNIRDTFWDDFMQACNNQEGMADLLQVRPNQIATWATRIKENLEKVQHADVRDDGEEKAKTKIIDTGDGNLGGIAVGEF